MCVRERERGEADADMETERKGRVRVGRERERERKNRQSEGWQRQTRQCKPEDAFNQSWEHETRKPRVSCFVYINTSTICPSQNTKQTRKNSIQETNTTYLLVEFSIQLLLLRQVKNLGNHLEILMLVSSSSTSYSTDGLMHTVTYFSKLN